MLQPCCHLPSLCLRLPIRTRSSCMCLPCRRLLPRASSCCRCCSVREVPLGGGGGGGTVGGQRCRLWGGDQASRVDRQCGGVIPLPLHLVRLLLLLLSRRRVLVDAGDRRLGVARREARIAVRLVRVCLVRLGEGSVVRGCLRGGRESIIPPPIDTIPEIVLPLEHVLARLSVVELSVVTEGAPLGKHLLAVKDSVGAEARMRSKRDALPKVVSAAEDQPLCKEGILANLSIGSESRVLANNTPLSHLGARPHRRHRPNGHLISEIIARTKARSSREDRSASEGVVIPETGSHGEPCPLTEVVMISKHVSLGKNLIITEDFAITPVSAFVYLKLVSFCFATASSFLETSPAPLADQDSGRIRFPPC
mmetsp:Transcript_56142/g.114798  ORF Transcript_56142/g.114798 Transcript_56142/m.114798 type:complete len:366 (+) Transcript_56142:467-1564(+)